MHMLGLFLFGNVWPEVATLRVLEGNPIFRAVVCICAYTPHWNVLVGSMCAYESKRSRRPKVSTYNVRHRSIQQLSFRHRSVLVESLRGSKNGCTCARGQRASQIQHLHVTSIECTWSKAGFSREPKRVPREFTWIKLRGVPQHVKKKKKVYE